MGKALEGTTYQLDLQWTKVDVLNRQDAYQINVSSGESLVAPDDQQLFDTEHRISADWLAEVGVTTVAMESTGAARQLAHALVSAGSWLPPWAMLGALLVVSMVLSNIVNNAATAVLMAPVALNTATALGASLDPFLMAVALGSTAAFLTPIGHPSNTLVMGPGGYLFTDYWKLGLPLSLLVLCVGLPAILWWWPLT